MCIKRLTSICIIGFALTVFGTQFFSAAADPILLSEVGRLVNSGVKNGILQHPGLVNQITISGSYIYASLDDTTLEIRDRATGTQISTIRPFTDSYGVQFVLRDNYVYIADWNAGLSIIDVTNKANPVLAGSWRAWDRVAYPNTFAQGVALNQNTAFLAITQYGIVTLDISNPHAPVQTGFLPEPTLSGSPSKMDRLIMHRNPDRLLVESYRGEWGYNFSDPNHLAQTNYTGMYPCIRVSYDAASDLMFMGSGYTDSLMFKIYNMTNPDTPVLLSTYSETLAPADPKKHLIRNITRVGDYLFVTDANRELIVLDISDLAHPQRVAYFPLPSDVSNFRGGFAVDGRTAYVGTSSAGMIMVDLGPLGFIPEPSSIVLAGTSIFGLFGALMALRRRKKN